MPFVHPIAFSIYILLLFVAPSAAFSIQDDSTKLVVFRDALNQDTLGNMAADTLPLFSKRMHVNFQDNLSNEATEKISLYPQLPAFLLYSSTFFFPEHQHFYYRSKAPLTEASYIIASNKEQVFRVLHNQNIKKGLHFFIAYHKIRSEGFYQHQLSDRDAISLGIKINNIENRYQALISGNYTDRYREENGGLNDTLFDQREFSNNRLYSVAMVDGISHHRNWSGEFRQKFYLNPNRKLSVEHQFRYDYRGFTYTGIAQNGYYQNIYLDSSSTQDHSFSESYRNIAMLRWQNRKWNLTSGTGWRSSVYHGEGIGMEGNIFFVKAIAQYADEHTEWNVDGEYYLNDHHSGDFKAELDYTRKLKSDAYRISFKGVAQRNSPYLNAVYYLSNHFFWTAVYEPTNAYSAELACAFHKERIKLTAYNYSVENGLYLDSLSVFRQHNDFAHVTGLKLDVLFSLSKHIHFKGDFLLQYSKENPVYRLPLFATSSSLYYSGKAWSMKYRTGIHFNYHTSYYGNSFNPALSAFYFQQNTLVGNYPMIDVFFETKIKTVDAFFAVHHVAEGLLGTDYYNAPGFPMTDRLFRFGIKWTFIN